MKVSGAGINKILNLYKSNNKAAEKKAVKTDKDTIELSSLGKSLSSFKAEEELINSKEKIERLQKEISKGTYNPNSKLIAKGIIDHMKGKGV